MARHVTTQRLKGAGDPLKRGGQGFGNAFVVFALPGITVMIRIGRAHSAHVAGVIVDGLEAGLVGGRMTPPLLGQGLDLLDQIEHRLGIGRAVDEADFGEGAAGNDMLLHRIPRNDPTGDGKAVIDPCPDFFPCTIIDDMGGKVETLVVDRRVMGAANRRRLVHFADIGETHKFGQRRLQRRAGHDLAMGIERLGRGIAINHPLRVITLGKRGIEFHRRILSPETRRPRRRPTKNPPRQHCRAGGILRMQFVYQIIRKAVKNKK